MLLCSPQAVAGYELSPRAGGTKQLTAIEGIETCCHKYFNESFVWLAWHGEWLHHLELQTVECARF